MKLKRLHLFMCSVIFATSMTAASQELVSPNFPKRYDITAGSIQDAATDNSGNAYVIYESGGSIYLKKNRDCRELISAGTKAAIAMDSAGNINVIYTNNGLKYKKRTGPLWGPEREVSACGKALGTEFYSIDTDSSGNAHIAADYGGSLGHIIYTKDNGDSWSGPIAELTGSAAMKCQSPVIRIDCDNKYHLAYVAEIAGSNHINIDSNSSNGNISSGGYGSAYLTSNAMSLNGAVAYIAYAADGEIHIAQADSKWAVLESFTGATATISYCDLLGKGVAYASSGVKYRADTGAGFSAAADIDAAGVNPIAVLDSENSRNPYVYFEKPSTSRILLATDKIIVSTDATVTSKTYEVSTLGGISRAIVIPAGQTIKKTAFLGALSKGDLAQTWNTSDILDPIVSGNKLVVTAENGSRLTYTLRE